MEKNSIRWEILLKGARGTLSPEEEIIFQKWLARDIRHKAYYEKMCRVWSSDNTTYDLHTDVAEMIVRFDDYVRNKRQGIFDPAFLSQVGIPVYSPSNYAELRHWLPILLSDEMQGPRAIRYPRGGESAALAQFGCSGREYDRLYTAPDAKAVMVSYADEVEDVARSLPLMAARWERLAICL